MGGSWASHVYTTEMICGCVETTGFGGGHSGESCGPKCPWLVPTPKGVPESDLTTWVVYFDADSSLII